MKRLERASELPSKRFCKWNYRTYNKENREWECHAEGACALQAFDYVSARSIEQVVSLLSLHGEHARILNGGTDLIVQLRGGARRASLLVDIKPIPEVNQLTYDPVLGLIIGAAVPCWSLCSHPAVIKFYPGLVDAASLIGGVQIQSRATVGGNLCNASPAADSIPALIVHQAVC
jgi:xanthine dehydrogenase FAD-binding subunit